MKYNVINKKLRELFSILIGRVQGWELSLEYLNGLIYHPMTSQIGKLVILAGIGLLITVKFTQGESELLIDEEDIMPLEYNINNTDLIDPDTLCMAQNIYHEARNESTAGMIAVGNVTLNRVEDPRFPSTVCEVVFQGPHYESWKTRQQDDLPEEERTYYPKKNRCQFSWYCDGQSDDITNKKLFQQILELSVEVRRGVYPDITDGATHYHADYVNPWWSRVYKKTVTIDTHIFYRNESRNN